MRPFEYATPKTKQEVPGLLGTQWGETEVLAGGTDLLGLMKDEVTAPHRLVNIKEIEELRGVTVGADSTRIGSLMTLHEISEDEKIQKAYPVFALAAGEAASPQVRHMATMGGNLCQRPRCWYFRTGHGLLALDKEGKSLVLAGDNRYHAILGNNGPAYFVSPSTVAPVLIAYGASVRIHGPKRSREIPLEKFFVIPKNEKEREHDLGPNEFITDIILPGKLAPGLKVAHYEIRQKAAFDWPYATAAVALTMNGNTINNARVVLGHVAPIPWVSEEAAKALRGKALNEDTADQAASAALVNAKSLGRNKEKIALARVALKRAILKVREVA